MNPAKEILRFGAVILCSDSLSWRARLRGIVRDNRTYISPEPDAEGEVAVVRLAQVGLIGPVWGPRHTPVCTDLFL